MPILYTSEMLDTRDLIERQSELREELETYAQDLAVNDAQQWDNLPKSVQERYTKQASAENPDEVEELEEIDAIEDAGIPDFPYGEAMIREDYFTTYAQELAADLGQLADESAWPQSYINWNAAADALKIDYVEVEYQGWTYLARG